MATRFPLELITSLSTAPDFSPVIWNGSELYVADQADYNLATISTRLNDSIDAFANFQAAHGTNISSISNLNTEIASIIPKITMFDASIENINTEIADINVILGAYAGRISPLEIRFGDLNANVIAMISDMSRIRTEYTKLNSRVEVLELNGGYTARISTLESDSINISSRVDSLENSSSTHSGDIDQLKVQLSDLISRIDAVERDVATVL